MSNWDSTGTFANWNIGWQQSPCTIRLKRDLAALYSDPPPGIHVVHDERNMTMVHALIIGSNDTPYAGGMFYFLIRIPSDYPIQPPHVQLLTTDAGKVRFNPNLYSCGKVCLSILGTWSGPAWSAAHTLSSVLISIQSLMNEKPLYNEPDWKPTPGDSERYNEVVIHETLRVAVLGMVNNNAHLAVPDPLRDIIEKTFLKFYDNYVALATSKRQMHNTVMRDPLGNENNGTFIYEDLIELLPATHARIQQKLASAAAAASSTSSETA